MLLVVVVMTVILAVCGLLVAYVAFPHRGEELPVAPWLGDAMAKAAEAMPVLDEDEGVDGAADGPVGAGGAQGTGDRGDVSGALRYADHR